MNEKEKLLFELAKKRQSNCYDGYKSIGDYANGAYECDYVSPYSKSAHNVSADVMIVLQDWSSDEAMGEKLCEETNKYGYTPNVQTNIRLIDLLKKYLKLELKDTYTTNLFPYIKMGDMSANINIKDMRKAANDFTLPMIEIIKPKIVIALGRKTFNALSDSCINKIESTDESFFFENTKVFHQPHPAARISNLEKEEKWNEMKNYLDNI